MSEYRDKLITVAIVEDDPMVRRVTEGFLAKVDGYICKATYASVKEAIKGISENRPDLVLLDLFFPIGSGMDVLNWIRKSELDVDVILITADHSAESISKAIRYGAVDYLVKPFRFTRFVEALSKYQKMREELVEGEITSQSKIDALINWSKLDEDDKDNQDDSVLKGIYHHDDKNNGHNTTYSKLLEYLIKHNKESFTASMVADKLGIARITARRYLDQMEKEGIIELHPEYGNIGRPQNYYQYKGEINEY